MLVLNRKREEEIVIGDDIVIKVLGAFGDVSLGITAPRSVPVHRREIADRIARESSTAAVNREVRRAAS